MLKTIIFCLVAAGLIGGAAGVYHLYKVNAKNKSEMAKFEQNVVLNTDLGKVLVVYYSLTGHTKEIAQQIAAKTKADVFVIETTEAYSSPTVYMKSKKELADKNYPAIKTENMPNPQDYDTVLVGGPVWWYTMAPALYTYLQSTDFGGVRVAPFSTQGSNFGSFFADFAANAKNAQILPEANFNNIDEKYQAQVANKINAWLNAISR